MIGEYAADMADKMEREGVKPTDVGPEAGLATKAIKEIDQEDRAKKEVRDATPEELKQFEEEYFNNKENKEGALALSTAFLELMGESKWFTVPQLMKRTGMDRLQAVQKLQMCKLFGHAAYRVGDRSDKKKLFNEPLWAIALTPLMKLKAMDAVIADTLLQIGNLERLYLQRRFLLQSLKPEQADKVN